MRMRSNISSHSASNICAKSEWRYFQINFAARSELGGGARRGRFEFTGYFGDRAQFTVGIELDIVGAAQQKRYFVFVGAVSADAVRLEAALSVQVPKAVLIEMGVLELYSANVEREHIDVSEASARLLRLLVSRSEKNRQRVSDAEDGHLGLAGERWRRRCRARRRSWI